MSNQNYTSFNAVLKELYNNQNISQNYQLQNSNIYSQQTIGCQNSLQNQQWQMQSQQAQNLYCQQQQQMLNNYPSYSQSIGSIYDSMALEVFPRRVLRYLQSQDYFYDAELEIMKNNENEHIVQAGATLENIKKEVEKVKTMKAFW